MKGKIVSITDHIVFPDIEKKILGANLSENLSKDSTILLVWHQLINAEYLDNYPLLKAIIRYGVGYDNIDLKECRKRGITVCNTPDYGVDEVADTALAMILSLTRKIQQLQTLARKSPSSWCGSPIPPSSKRLKEQSVGIIGLGRIGLSLATKLTSIFGKVSFYDPNLKRGIEKSLNLNRFDDVRFMLEESDVVSINTDLNESTNGMVGSMFLSHMRQGSILCNVSRGGIYGDPTSILNALRTGKLAGFGTDVWPSEPPEKNDLAYNEMQNDLELKDKVIITPHTSYFSDSSIVECRTKAALNAARILNDQIPFNILT